MTSNKECSLCSVVSGGPLAVCVWGDSGNKLQGMGRDGARVDAVKDGEGPTKQMPTVVLLEAQ